MSGLPILLLLVSAAEVAAAAQADGPPPVPLLDYRAELASDDRPYLHLTPDAVLIYFRTTLLKTLPVERMDRGDRAPLRLSRVESWYPELRRPVVIVEGKRDEDLAGVTEVRLRLEDVPSTFTLLLRDRTVVLVTADESQRRAVDSLLKRNLPEAERPPLLLQMKSEHDARQLYWHLQNESAVIY